MRTMQSEQKAFIENSWSLNKARPSYLSIAEGIFLHLGLVLTDIIMISLSLRFAYFLRFDLNLSIFDPQAISSATYYQSLVIYTIIPIWLLVFFLRGLYHRQNLLGGTREYDLLFQSSTFAMFIVIAIGFFEQDFVFARGWILISWLSAILFTFTGRFLFRRLIYTLREKGFFLARTIIVGYNDEAVDMAEQLMNAKNSGMQVVGFVSDEEAPAISQGIKRLGTLAQLDVVIEKHQVQEVILTNSALSREQFLWIFEQFGISRQVKLRMSSGLYEVITTGLQVKEVAWVPLVEVNKVRLTGMDLGLKTFLDYSLTIPAVILLSPLFLLIAAMIRLDSPGPIIHRRRVMGVNGKPFYAFKFRTMYTNGEEILDQFPEKKEELLKNHKLKDDPRVTRVGAILRKLSLDEFPQFFNVLRNEMSLVGPRMITPDEVLEYHKWGINLLTVKPGITGKWQVSGRSDVTYQERVRLDMFYIRNWNIWMDIQLLIQTIPAVLSRRGAY